MRVSTVALGALCAVVLMLTVSASATAQSRITKGETLTIDSFRAQLTEEPLAGADFRPFECGEIGDVPACKGNVRLGEAGATVLIKGKAKTSDLTYAGFLMANPALIEEAEHRERLASLYMLLAARMTKILSPDASPKAKADMLLRLARNMDRRSNDVRVGSWTYGASGGMMLSFTAERAK